MTVGSTTSVEDSNAAVIGWLKGAVEVEVTVGATACGESAAIAVGSVTGGGSAEQAASRRADNATAIRATVGALLRLIVSPR